MYLFKHKTTAAAVFCSAAKLSTKAYTVFRCRHCEHEVSDNRMLLLNTLSEMVHTASEILYQNTLMAVGNVNGELSVLILAHSALSILLTNLALVSHGIKKPTCGHAKLCLFKLNIFK